MTTLLWERATRERLRALAPEAVAVLPVGAVEQHGPHLPTGTDALVAGAVARAACERLPDGVTALLAPTLAYGSSDHHLPFGGTLSLSPATLAAVLGDLLRSLRAGGCERALIVNAHGGNAEICGAVAQAAAIEHDMLAAAVSYWRVSAPPATLAGWPFPGHAGAYETSLVLALAGDDVDVAQLAPSPAVGGRGGERRVDGGAPADPLAGTVVADPRAWVRLGGWTDDPREASAAAGEDALERAANAVADVIAALARRDR
ncbi:creatininase family protein [Conexibacter woesei]|uniref:Creatininase n=1 Tax=Conexibacter woesei (strain DSM 14684 / CCUG 47730 / CIP 108061 / JCM 11494 / NBRC 100937 / ID131577) TaxID=469383 RepID=D3FBU4_CONWI|nr:creatininase family protein [Conexibacter woesei]ADB51359.1 Creatininase [Conexibacter woesei DSM 14684]